MLLELTDADFDAYGEGRTRATALTKPRSDVKRRLVGWGRAVAERLAVDGIDLEVTATDEHPSARNGHRVEAQSVFLFRAAGARRAMRQGLGSSAPREDEGRAELGNARIELRIDASSASLLLWFGADARVDLESAVAVLGSAAAEAVWQTLPASVSFDARPSLSSRARRIDGLTPADAVGIARAALDAEVPLVIGCRIARGRAVQASALASWFDDAVALGRFLAAVAWSPENAAARPNAPRERPSSRRSRRSRPERPIMPPPPPLDPGAHVRALTGPFAGQSGVVQELDGKGGARVLFGLLAARVEVRDLVVATAKRGRTLLSSSHRKPSS